MADLGCWPGGWLQVAAAAVEPSGRVVGVDRAAIEPPLENANAVAFVSDLEDPALGRALLEALGGPADVVLCDAAPKLTGVRDVDRAAEERLLEAVEALLPGLLCPEGTLLLKVLDGPEAQAVERRLRGLFARARTCKPRASRKGTSERYLLAFGFRPLGLGRA